MAKKVRVNQDGSLADFNDYRRWNDELIHTLKLIYDRPVGNSYLVWMGCYLSGLTVNGAIEDKNGVI